MVDVTVNRSKGVNVTVDKKDSGEVVSSAQDTPTLINAGVASQIISSLSLLTGDVNVANPNQGDLLIYNGSFWTTTTVTGDATISNTGVITIDQTAVSGISNIQFEASESSLQIILSSGGQFDTVIPTGVTQFNFDDPSGKNKLHLSNGTILETSVTLDAFTTSNLNEGSDLYYTVARANSAIDDRVTKSFVESLNISSFNAGATFTSDVVVEGNLVVTGTQTSIDTSSLIVNDAIITVASGQDSGRVNAGLEVDRGADANVYFLWNESDNRWTITNDGSSYSNITFTSSATLVGNTAVFTRDDSTSYDLDLNGLVNGITTNAAWYGSNNTFQLIADNGDLIDTTINNFNNISVDNITITDDGGANTLTANRFIGDGSQVTAVDARALDGEGGSFYRIETASFESSNNTITFTRGDANTFDVTVSGGVTSGSLVGNTIILTKSDLSTVEIDVNALVNDIILSASFNTANNTLTLLQDDGGKVEVDVNAGVSSAAFAGSNNTLTFTKTDATTFDVQIHDNTSVSSASFDNSNNTITFTRDDSSTFDVQIHDNTSVTSATLIGNTAIFTRDDSSTFDLDLNGIVNGITTATAWYGANNTLQLTADNGDVFNTTISDFDNLTVDNITVTDDFSSNTISANRFVGDGAQVTSVDAAALDGESGSFYRIETAAFESSNNTITFTRGDANTFDIVIGGGVTSGQLVGNNIILTKSDSTTIDIDVNSLVNDIIQSGSYSVANNTLSLVDDQNDSLDIQLTGLANTSSPEFSGSVSVGETLYADSIIVDKITTNTQLVSQSIDFEPISHPEYNVEGRLFYDSVHKTFNYNTDVDNVNLELGENVYVRVFNDSSNTIPNGSALYLDGYTSTDPVVPKAQLADASDGVKYNTSGLAAHSIEAGTYGYCAVTGVVRGTDQDPFDTSYLTAGERAFVSFDTPGLLVQPAPSYPNFPMCMGLVVVSDANNGVFVVEQQMHAVPNFRVAGDAFIGNSLTVGGDLNVLGTETSVSLTNLNVGDTFFYLGTGNSVANTEFAGTGLNDAEYRDYYNGTDTKTYSVRIDSVGATDTFEWSVDDFSTTEATGVAITGGDQLLNDHIKIHFDAITGHTLNDRWDGDVTTTNLDHGWVGHYSNSTLYTHFGMFRDQADDEFKFFQRYDPEVSGTINTGHASFQYADIRANSFFGHTITANVTGDVSGTVSDISNHDTDALSEGSTNLYHTLNRVNTAIDNRVTRAFVDNLGVDAELLDSEEGGFYRIESAAYTVANNTLTFTRGDANTFDLALTGVANTSATVNTSTSSASFESTNNTITFTRADSSNFDVTIGGGVTSGALVGNNIILTKSDSSTIDIDVNALVNDIILAGSYSVANNTLSLTDDQNDAVDIQLTGLANTSSPVFSGSIEVADNIRADSLDIIGNISANNFSGTFVGDGSGITGIAGASNAELLDNEEGGFYRVESAAFESSNNTITFTRGDANTFDVTIGGGVTSGTLVGNNIVLTKSDSSTIDIDVNALVNDIILAGSYTRANNTLSLTDDQNDAIDITLTGLGTSDTAEFSNLIVDNNISSDSMDVEQFVANTITSTELEVNRDANGNTFLGKAVIGSYFLSGTTAFAHIDQATSTGFALTQTAAGTTILNSPNRIGFRYNGGGSDIVSITDTGMGIGIQSPEHALHITSGNAVISGSASGGGHLIVNNSIITDSIEATGSISANVFIGDGSQLTGLSVANTSTSSGSFDIGNNTIRFIRSDNSDYDVELTGIANTSSPIFTGTVEVQESIITDSITAVGDMTANVGNFNQIGIGTEPSSGFELDVDGDINFTGSFYYNGIPVDFTANSEPLVDNGIPVSTFVFTGNGSDTVFNGVDDRGSTMAGLGVEGQFQVYLNGVRLLSGTDFSANGTHITFTEAPLTSAKIQVTAYEQFNDDLKVRNHSFYSANSITTDGSTSEQIVDTYLASVYGASKYMMQVKEIGGNNMLAAEGLVVHDGAGATITTYGIVDTGTDFGTFDVDINSGSVRLLFTPSSTDYFEVKVQRTTLSI